VIWSAVKLALKTRSLPISQWETVLPEALHSIRLLLCTSTNSTPHERFLKFQRRSALGTSVTSWLNDGTKVLVKRHVRSSKFEPLVDEAEIIHATPSYAHVRLQNGREATVSLRDIAPVPGDVSFEIDEQVFLHGDDPCPVRDAPDCDASRYRPLQPLSPDSHSECDVKEVSTIPLTTK